MWRLVVIVLFAVLILKLVAGIRVSSKPASSPPPPSGQSPEGPELVRDALSGVFFDKALALTVALDGRTLYFISKANRDAYLGRIASGSGAKH